MNSMRLARAALRARPAMVPRIALQRRTYADAVPDKASTPAESPAAASPGAAAVGAENARRDPVLTVRLPCRSS